MIDACGNVCRYLVGQPGADFLVQCNEPAASYRKREPWNAQRCERHQLKIDLDPTDVRLA